MIISEKCPCSGGTLDKLVQPAILAVLSKGPSHGYQIAEEIGKMPNSEGEKPDTSGIYRFLKSMESKGLVVSSWDTPASGHAKRLFEITADGKSCLNHWVKTLEQYHATIASLLKIARAAAASKKRKASNRSPKLK
jgi:PadR family transcriptional regulator, regulatory protein PadR